MKTTVANLMLYIGCALMAYNIYRYMRFSGQIRERGNWKREEKIFRIPIVLLILFLAGYISIAIFGHPNPVVSAILFGGSVFVLVMLLLIQRTVNQIQENEKLEAKVAAAEEASRAKTVFLSNMSHDIRTPLNAIVGFTALAKGPQVALEQKNDYLGKIEKASHQLLDIVNDVLEMSRIESGKMELDPRPANLEECVREAGDLVSAQLKEKKISFSVHCEAPHPWVLCDTLRLNRALMNLLCNAGKFTGENGCVSLSLRELAFDGDTGTYEIQVKDNGIGMSPDFVDKLFTPFERERTSTVSKIQGTGLGMAITKNIVDLMGGEIQVITEQGKGTEFILTFCLPIVETTAAPGHSAGPERFDGVRALLVEDNEVNMEIATMILSQAGIQVDRAENGKIAVQKVQSSPAGSYDLIFMDIQMPVMGGYTAAKEIRSLSDPARASIPIIAMTANAFAEDIRAAEESGMNGHVAKPIEIKALMKAIADVLNR